MRCRNGLCVSRKRKKIFLKIRGRVLGIDLMLLKSFALATLYFFLVFYFMPPLYAATLLIATALAMPIGFGSPDDWDFAVCMISSAVVGAITASHFGPLPAAFAAMLTFGTVMVLFSNLNSRAQSMLTLKKDEEQAEEGGEQSE